MACVSMLSWSAVDHPHGGGRGKSKGGRVSVSPWGMPVSCLVCYWKANQTHIHDRRKEDTRHVSSVTPTSMLCESGCVIKASDAPRSKGCVRACCIIDLTCVVWINTVHNT